VLEHQIAEGGMGTIWAAEHTALRRRVAVKFASTNPAHADAARRLEHEGRTMARIRSQYVPQVFDEGKCADGTPFVVMELLDGIDLATWAERYGRLDVDQVARMLEQVGQALAAAHEVGIVHRDVKPENIIFTGGSRDFEAKLVDFGIAKSVGLSLSSPSLTMAGIALGSSGYMSPEQLISARDVDERSDIWSLGVVAYWCLTGRLPFAADTFGAMCLLVHGGHFVPASELRPELSRDLDEWFDKALSREADHRFQSTGVMSKMFRVAACGQARLSDANATSTPPLALDTGGATMPRGMSFTRPVETALPQKRMQGGRVALTLGAGFVGFVGALAIAATPMFRVASVGRAGFSPPPASQSKVIGAVSGTGSLPPPGVPYATNPPAALLSPDPLGASQLLSVAAAMPAAPAKQAHARSAARPSPHPTRRPPPAPTPTTAPSTWFPTDELGEAGERPALQTVSH
jgi:serine/threonine-protein kinase